MIQKKIHYCWFGGTPLPEKDRKCIESWKKYCPDYEIIEWNENNYDVTKNRYMYEAYKNKKWGFVPDYARLDIIYQNGGIYLDTDVELIRPFNELLNADMFCGFENEGIFVNLGQGFAAEKGHALLKSMLKKYENLKFVNKDGTLNLAPSPKYQTESLVSWGLDPNNHLQYLNGNVIVYPVEYFCPKSFITGEITITDNTYSIHHFNMSWIDNSDKNLIIIRQKLCKYFGKLWGIRISKIVEFPHRVVRKIKMKGIIGTIKFIIEKYIKQLKHNY